MEPAAGRGAFERHPEEAGIRRAPRGAQVQRDAEQARRELALEYLQFDDAWLAIEAARDEAFATGARVPPYPLDACDRETIESALYAPQTGFGRVEKYPDLPAKAAALLYALAKSQACPDGNKRVAVILLMEFLAINGATLNIAPDAFADMILTVAASDAADRDEVLETLTDEIRPVIIPLDMEDL